ncbi:MAG: RNA-binding protein [Luteitalea sp.]|nr:RNA-binding protein [Luteitalea sp.]
MSRKLYVGNLPFETSEADLEALFSRVGTVDTVQVMRDMVTGRARGFAFVEMASDEDAQNAIRELHETQLGGRTLTVNEARPKPAMGGGPRPFGEGRRNGGGGGGRGGRRREPRW